MPIRICPVENESNAYRQIDDFTNTAWPFHRYDAPVFTYIPEYSVTRWADNKLFL